MKHAIVQIVPLAIVFSVLLGYQYLGAAWTEPSASPTNGNVAAPINVSNTAQVKNGALSVDAFTSFGQARIEYGAPTLRFADTNDNDWWIHNNGDRMYFITDRDDDGTWNGNNPWPLMLSATGADSSQDYALFSRQVRATEYCDRSGNDCTAAADMGGGGGTIVSGWPDAIYCVRGSVAPDGEPTAGSQGRVYFADYMPNTDGRYYYRTPASGNAYITQVFNSNGTHYSESYGVTNCNNKSITQLANEGKAFSLGATAFTP